MDYKKKVLLNRRGLVAILIALSMFSLIFTGCTSNEADTADDEVLVGIAWTNQPDSEFYTNIIDTVEEAGGTPVLLDQVIADYLPYDDNNDVVDCSDEIGALTQDTADTVKEKLWEDTNVEDVMEDIDAVIFTGGNDISTSLYAEPVPWHGIEEEIDYNATRDVSDYILMSYCIENDISTMGFCRGMQMIAVVGGASVIQDLPVYFADLNKEYNYEHRNETEAPGDYRDYIPHDVTIAKDTLAYEIYQEETVAGCPSWHHQAILSVEGTDLIVSGSNETNSEDIVEIIEYTGKNFVLGCQYHPEAAVMKHVKEIDNAGEFMDYETGLLVFEALIDSVEQ